MHNSLLCYIVFKREEGAKVLILIHLSNPSETARMEIIPSVLVNIANKMELAANILFVATVTNLARHPENAEHLVYNLKGLVPTLLFVLLRNCRIIACLLAIYTAF